MRRRWAAAGDESRGGAALNSRGESQSGAPGVRSGCRLAVGGVRDMRSPPGGLFGFGEARSGVVGDDGGSGRRVSPAQPVRGSTGSTAYLNQHKRGPEGVRKLTGARA